MPRLRCAATALGPRTPLSPAGLPGLLLIPAGAYREEEEMLREFGALVPEDADRMDKPLRALAHHHQHVRHYSSLIGRAPYLWDNTIYARHAQPTYA